MPSPFPGTCVLGSPILAKPLASRRLERGDDREAGLDVSSVIDFMLGDQKAGAKMGLVIFDLDGTLTPQRPASTADFERKLCRGIAERCDLSSCSVADESSESSC